MYRTMKATLRINSWNSVTSQCRLTRKKIKTYMGYNRLQQEAFSKWTSWCPFDLFASTDPNAYRVTWPVRLMLDSHRLCLTHRAELKYKWLIFTLVLRNSHEPNRWVHLHDRVRYVNQMHAVENDLKTGMVSDFQIHYLWFISNLPIEYHATNRIPAWNQAHKQHSRFLCNCTLRVGFGSV